MKISTEQVLSKRLARLYPRYLVPTMCGALMGSLYGSADLFFIGNGVGKDALAALSIATPMYMVFSALVCLFGSGAATVIAVCIGEGEKEEANQFFTISLLLQLVCGLAIMTGFQLFTEPIARFLGATDLLVGMVTDYIRVVSWATPLFLVSWSLGSFIRVDGDPTLVMWASIVPNLFNILMDWVFVFPLGMGIVGAALATALSPILGILLMLTHFLRRRNTLRLVRPHFTAHRFGRMVRNGGSYCVQEISGGVLIFAFNAVLLRLAGESAVSVYAVVMNVGWIVMSLIGAFIGAAAPIIGVNLGAGKYERCRGSFRIAAVCAAGFTLVATALLMLFPGPVVALFSAGDTSLAGLSAEAGVLYFPMLIPAALNMTVLGLAQACEWFRQSLIISFSRSFVLLLTSLLVLSALFGLTGAWLAALVAEALTAVFSVLICRALWRDFRRREQLERLGEKLAVPDLVD